MFFLYMASKMEFCKCLKFYCVHPHDDVFFLIAGFSYYLSTPSADEPFLRHIYSSNGCLTCNIKTPEGNDCTYASASFSRDFTYYVATCSGPDPSTAKIYKINLSSQANEVMTWEDNVDLRQRLALKDLPKTRIMRVAVDGGFSAAVKIQYPSEIDLDADSVVSGEKYPMLVRVYGGPGSVRVLHSFGIGYQTYQVSKKKIIFVEIDGRGTSLKGNDMMFSLNNKLGTIEAEDQIAVANHLVEKFKFIDPARVAIWGWSYGGYASAMALARDTKKVFKCGISVAPVTSWRFANFIVN